MRMWSGQDRWSFQEARLSRSAVDAVRPPKARRIRVARVIMAMKGGNVVVLEWRLLAKDFSCFSHHHPPLFLQSAPRREVTADAGPHFLDGLRTLRLGRPIARAWGVRAYRSRCFEFSCPRSLTLAPCPFPPCSRAVLRHIPTVRHKSSQKTCKKSCARLSPRTRTRW